jgi:hypothetical protein
MCYLFSFLYLETEITQSCKRIIPIERPPFNCEVSANFCEYKGCRVVNTAESYGRNFSLLDQSRYFFFQIAAQLCSRGSVDPVPDPLLLRKSGSAGNRIRTSGSVGRNSDHVTNNFQNGRMHCLLSGNKCQLVRMIYSIM